MQPTMPFLIIDAPAGVNPDGIPDHPFHYRGRIDAVSVHQRPHWLPPAPTCFYLDTRESRLYRSDANGTPLMVGNLEAILLGAEVAERIAHGRCVPVRFTDCDDKRLAAYLEDDTEVDLPVEKARAALLAGEAIALTRDVLRYAVQRAVETVGTFQAGLHGNTLRRVFGTVS